MKHLALHQQLALLDVMVPDCILDFLLGFQEAQPLSKDVVRKSLDANYLRDNEVEIIKKLGELRASLTQITDVSVVQAAKDIPGGFVAKLTFGAEGVTRGVGFIVKIKQSEILRLALQKGEYSLDAILDELRNPK